MESLRLKPVSWGARAIRLGNEPVTIGRHPENTIRLKDEKASRFHCIVEANGGTFRIRDLDSRNGIKVNGERTRSAVLAEGDVIVVGSSEFVVETITDEEPDLESPKAPSRGKSSKDPQWARDLERTIDLLPPKQSQEEDVSLIDARGEPSDALKGSGEGPRAARLLFQASSKSHATDIHMEPKVEHVQIRMRVDGQMITIVELPNKVGELVGGLVKTACHMKTAGRDSVLDGHFATRFPDRRVDYRASFTPSVHGQKLVLRVLDMRDVPKSLAEMDIAPYMADRIRRVCEQDHGLLLVCGPTGSGKTTTLYNALREIDREARNVVTIEDPVEYRLDGVTQIPIKTEQGNSFGSMLRSVLRQDPDVILVGEIRDEETARTAMQAAMTGHVVFSTIHANNTIAAVFRLLDLGVEPYLVANSLDLVLAQRLVRVLCASCKRPVQVPPGVATRLGRFLGNKTEMMMPTGCEACLNTGYRGRKAIFELLDVNNDMRDVILSTPSIQAIRKIAAQGLFTTLAQSGWKLVADGTTNLEEVDKVAGQG
jgi:general secretion pathway protein E